MTVKNQKVKKGSNQIMSLQQEVSDNNKKAGWWERKPELKSLEEEAVKVILMHMILSEQLEKVRRGENVNFDKIITEVSQLKDKPISESIDEETAFLLTKISLMHSELSEACEYIMKPEKDKHLIQHEGEAVELSDMFLRLLDYCGHRGFNVENISREKLEYNKTRSDHKKENRKVGGKLF